MKTNTFSFFSQLFPYTIPIDYSMFPLVKHQSSGFQYSLLLYNKY